MEELVGLLAWLAVEMLLVGTGRIAVRALSLGRWRGEVFGGNEARVHAAAGALSFRRDGQRVFTRTGLAFAGIFTWIAFALMLITP